MKTYRIESTTDNRNYQICFESSSRKKIDVEMAKIARQNKIESYNRGDESMVEDRPIRKRCWIITSF